MVDCQRVKLVAKTSPQSLKNLTQFDFSHHCFFLICQIRQSCNFETQVLGVKIDRNMKKHAQIVFKHLTTEIDWRYCDANSFTGSSNPVGPTLQHIFSLAQLCIMLTSVLPALTS